MSAVREIMSRVDWRARQLCKYCDDLDHTGSHENTMVLCDCCVATGAHVKCLAKYEGKVITPEQIDSPAFIWFCGSVCNQVHLSLLNLTGPRRSLDKFGIFSAELVRYSKIDRQSQNAVRAAENMFKSAFVATPCADGRDMIEVVCRGEIGQEDASELPGNDDDSEEPVPDCTNFRVFVLRKGGTIVSAAAIRVHGDLFVEVPYVATREGYRREGNCHRLMTALESFLSDIGVRWILLQAAETTVPIWTKGFEFMEATEKVVSEVEDRVILPEGTILLLKSIAKENLNTLNTEKESGKGRSLASVPETEKPSKRQRIRFELPIATIFGDDDSYSSSASSEESSSFQIDEDDSESECIDEDEIEQMSFIAEECIESKDTQRLPTSPIPAQLSIKERNLITRSCANCRVEHSNKWRRDDAGNWICHACYQYKRSHGKPRPESLWHSSRIKPQLKSCANCMVEHSTQWLRDDGGDWTCWACYQYKRSHGKPRPESLWHSSRIKPQLKSCANCRVEHSNRWYRDDSGNWTCDACYQYKRIHGRPRPESLWHSSKIKPQLKSCANCRVEHSNQWCRDDAGNWICYACYDYKRIHGKPRPESLFQKFRNTGTMQTVSRKRSHPNDEVNETLPSTIAASDGGILKETASYNDQEATACPPVAPEPGYLHDDHGTDCETSVNEESEVEDYDEDEEQELLSKIVYMVQSILNKQHEAFLLFQEKLARNEALVYSAIMNHGMMPTLLCSPPPTAEDNLPSLEHLAAMKAATERALLQTQAIINRAQHRASS